MLRRKKPGVFCVEGDWSPDLTDRSSVRPALEALEHDGVDYIYENVHTFEGLQEVVRRWPHKRYANFTVGYFAFHGDPGLIWIGSTPITLKQLGSALAGKCKDKTIYFSSCGVLDTPLRAIEEFRALTGARCVAGYTEDIEWYLSLAFEIVLLGALTHYRNLGNVDRYLEKYAPDLRRALGFRMHYGLLRQTVRRQRIEGQGERSG